MAAGALGALVIAVSACSHVEARRITAGSWQQPADDDSVVLRLTRPAWEVAPADSGAPTFRLINVWDPHHVYRVRLARGWFGRDSLVVAGPDRNVREDCAARRASTSSSIEGIVCPEFLGPQDGWPSAAEVVDRFRQSGRRVFSYAIPLPDARSSSQR